MSAPCYVHRHRVTFDETNVVGNVYFAQYLHWQGHCREMFLAEHAPGVVADLQAGRLALVTVSCSADFYAELFAMDVVEVHMSLRSSSGNRVEMSFDYLRDSALVARGHQGVACMERSATAMVPIPVPVELDDALRAYRPVGATVGHT